MAAGRDARASPAACRRPSARWPTTTPPSSTRLHAARRQLAEDRAQPRWSPRTGWRKLGKDAPAGRSRCCRSTRRRWASPRPTAAACCTRSRCGPWPPTCPIPRAGSTPVPEAAYDERLHEWRVREAMARSRLAGALAAIRRMGDSAARRFALAVFRGAPGRARRRQGRAPSRLYRSAARKPEFHGFLAADRLDAPVRAVPVELATATPAERAAVARDPAIVRAMALYRIERNGWAAARVERGAVALRRRPAPHRGGVRAGQRLVRPRGVLARPRPQRRRPARGTAPVPRCASRCTTPPPSAAKSRASTARPGLGRGRDPRREHLQSRARAPPPTRWA